VGTVIVVVLISLWFVVMIPAVVAPMLANRTSPERNRVTVLRETSAGASGSVSPRQLPQSQPSRHKDRVAA